MKYLSLLLLVSSTSLFATESAGGKWTVEASADKLTGQVRTIFSLVAVEAISDGISSSFPIFEIVCGTGDSPRWIQSELDSPVVLGSSGFRSALSDAPQQMVQLRADSRIRAHFWNIAGDWRTFFVDRQATKEVMNGADVRIGFTDVHSYRRVAVFAADGLDRDKVAAACGKALR
ncbi:MAG: hypothetical protein KGL39_41240 [Patescibacteria group bacterium]|nr:hypothetical protein [Patescibacteria group bacterium]